jgi:hypothetical protein
MNVYDLHGICIFECDFDGPRLRTAQDANDLIGEAGRANASLVVLPVDRLPPEFFELRTGLAGEMLQKFVNYRKRLAILGDFSAYTTASKSFRDFVTECNRGNSIWFLSSRDELEARLRAKPQS